MKILIFEPHPDDLMFGPGPILLEWIKQKAHEIYIVTVTDGRACFRASDDFLSEEAKIMTEDQVAEMRINEAKNSIEFLGIPPENHHLLYFHDADGQKFVKEGIIKIKTLKHLSERLCKINTAYKGLWFAEPEVKDIRKIMRYVYENKDELGKKSIKARDDVKDKFSWKNISNIASEKLEEIDKRVKNE